MMFLYSWILRSNDRRLFHKWLPRFFFSSLFLMLASLLHNIVETESWSSQNILSNNHKLRNSNIKNAIVSITLGSRVINDFSEGYNEYSDRLFFPYDGSFNTINSLVQQRTQARNQRNYTLADLILKQLESFSWDGNQTKPLNNIIRPGYKISTKDIPLREGGGTTWDIVPAVPFVNNHPTTQHNSEDDPEKCTVLQLAHMALGLAIINSSSNNKVINYHESKLLLIQRAERRLIATHGTDLYGRAAADAALWFALANTADADASANENIVLVRFFEYLVQISTNELLRYGNRPSCASKHILHILERFAAAGLDSSSPSVRKLHSVGADCLEQKLHFDNASNNKINVNNLILIIKSLRDGTFDLHSKRSLLLLWKFSTKQRKQRSFVDSAVRHAAALINNTSSEPSGSYMPSLKKKIDATSWSLLFDDPNKPLVIDIGCGMGMSVLGLASLSSSPHITTNSATRYSDNTNTRQSSEGESSPESSVFNFDDDYWSQCNFAGVDLSRLAIGYATGVATRLGLKNKNVNFFVSSAEDFLARVVDSYPGHVKLIMIQFPTPFRFSPSSPKNEASKHDDNNDEASNVVEGMDEETDFAFFKGNSQLPSNGSRGGFMITKNLLMLTSSALKKVRGHVLLQSNCEDVAVAVKNLAIQEAGFQCLNVDSGCGQVHDGSSTREGRRIPQRTALYVAEGGERAEGRGWSQLPILPKRGSTETEAACQINGTPIHRCILTPLESYNLFKAGEVS